MAKKKTYYIPMMEVVDLKGEYPLTALTPSKEWHPAPRRRWTDVF